MTWYRCFVAASLPLINAADLLSQNEPSLLQHVMAASQTLAASPASATDYYAEDIILLPEYQPVIRGRDDAARYVAKVYGDGGLRRSGDRTTEWHDMDSVVL